VPLLVLLHVPHSSRGCPPILFFFPHPSHSCPEGHSSLSLRASESWVQMTCPLCPSYVSLGPHSLNNRCMGVGQHLLSRGAVHVQGRCHAKAPDSQVHLPCRECVRSGRHSVHYELGLGSGTRLSRGPHLFSALLSGLGTRRRKLDAQKARWVVDTQHEDPLKCQSGFPRPWKLPEGQGLFPRCLFLSASPTPNHSRCAFQ
jgi:hypothetical protein